jgi:adenylate cyclase class IV
MTDTYEIEIKSLLGAAEEAERLRSALRKIDPSVSLASSYSQLNHYFEGGDPAKLAEALAPHVSPEALEKMRTIASEGKSLSVRTREMNGETRMVMKASIGSDSSDNGVMRLEVEEAVPLSLDELDALVLSCGFTYQAKWSRTREEYRLGDVAVCLDKNAGYGYLAEFEKVVHDAGEAERARAELEELMGRLGVSELPQDRLERMFSHYNAHWQEYYGTDNIFTIE